MSRPSKFWRVAVAIFVVVNAGGAVFAVANGEWMHAGTHAGLLFLTFLAWPLVSPGRRDEVTQTLPPTDESLAYIQQSVDAIALEVERIGEAQRYAEKLQAERIEKSEGER